MRGMEASCLRIAAVTIVSVLLALPSAAITEEEMMAVCEEWILNHEGDQEWEQTCFEAIQEWESQQPPAVMLAEMEYPPAGPFPIEEAAIPGGPHDGDLTAIVQTLESGSSVDIIVEFEVSEVRDEIHAKAVEEEHLFLGDDQLAEKRVAYASIKVSGLAGLLALIRE